MHTAREFTESKAQGRKISVVTAYDAWSARLVANSTVDAMLVGDSVAMVVHGHPTTLTATLEMMALHTRAVARAAGGKFVIADLPFLTYRKGLPAAMEAVGTLVTSGAHAVKLEGVVGQEDLIAHVVTSGVPVMGHLGLMPQHVHQTGGYRVQGRTDEAADLLIAHARTLEALGCFAIVVECVPTAIAARLTDAVTIPTIGIGAGAGTDGQVLVLHDLIGLTMGQAPRFVRQYLNAQSLLTLALDTFDQDVKAARFPALAESYP
jgi:3-methyl-2-oxobutanoate hydroxymethyltransferase